MKTILNKLIFGGLFIFLSWKGLDGLIINTFHGNTETFDISQLEQSKIIESRNINIVNGISYKEDFIYYEENQFSPVDIVYPLLSFEQAERLANSEPISVKILVRLNNQNRDCLTSGNCLPVDSASVNGLVKTGLENLKSSDFETLETDLLRLDENAILIELNDKPILWYWNLAMFAGGTIFGFAILKSFFRRANSIEEYWTLVTEKDQS
ncbi:hypothetical protein J0A68_09720 [Algoriphagus sp. H41]|uniref:Uncharacterized protein n=1 Tax=Algoriphagus oliviformis TaxID=2811231 RepID=A0ABS3C299_9BACT|nr:hypothetical protein [Algoriphagus oliviformis]MBN7811235.1 hypothetical protein [Algoriphagus oliviformis]